MKYIIKLLLIAVVLFAGCYYFKVISTEYGFNVMNCDYTVEEFSGKVVENALELNTTTVDKVTYWEIPFANKYYVAADVKFETLLTGKVEEQGLYVFIIDKEVDENNKDVTLEVLNSVTQLAKNKEQCQNWILYVFGVLTLVILFFPTKKH